jgi:uncharacterized cysteine cluster protein YcgN (CxxCxxCC family)
MTPKRTCDSCTACCEGWLNGEAHGHTFYPSKPCFFLNKGCTIYEDRPENPCKSYDCAWLAEDTFPMWMRPDLSKIIISKRIKNDISYYEIGEMGEQIKAHILNWIIQWALNSKQNILYYIMGSKNKLGTDGFLELDV